MPDKHFARLGGTVWKVIIAGGVLAALIGLAPFLWERMTNAPPTIDWTLSATDGTAPLSVVVNVSAQDPDRDELTYSWYLNDELQTEGSLTHYEYSLEEPGDYRIRTVVSDGSESISRLQLIRVSAPEIELDGMTLSEPLIIDRPEANVRFLNDIITNAHDVKLRANAIIGQPVRIRSFQQTTAPDGANGDDGRAGANGQNGAGQDGADGRAGTNGGPGMPGTDAGSVDIDVAAIRTDLFVTNVGQSGGDGGTGGRGEQGGHGGRGQPSSAGFSIGGVGDCKSGPGRGGDGGDGGVGGRGGDAGPGGDGGPVLIRADTVDGTILVRSSGGAAGDPGSGGNPGQPGKGGDEGALNGPCGSAGRYGSDGTAGAPGAAGSEAAAGDPGPIEIVVGREIFAEDSGEFQKQW